MPNVFVQIANKVGLQNKKNKGQVKFCVFGGLLLLLDFQIVKAAAIMYSLCGILLQLSKIKFNLIMTLCDKY
jgi:hypothetical protein